MEKKLYFLLILLCALSALAQLDTLELLGKTPGGSSACVEYAHGRLYVGAGASLLIYRSEDPDDMVLLGSVDFVSLVTNIVVRDDSMVFVGANHDGLYAVDASDPDFPILAQYKMPDRGHWVADLEISPPDTLWLSDFTSLKKMIFTGDTFIVEEEYFSGATIVGAGFRDSLVAVCRRQDTVRGYVELYNRAGGLFTLIASYDTTRLKMVVDAEFADNRDDIIYVMGGSHDMGDSTGFYALHYDDSLYLADDLQFQGIRFLGNLLGQAFIMNMDSRNDTVFLATMAAMHDTTLLGIPWTDCPAIDCTFLPDSMHIIGHFIPGLWFFDVALHDSLSALAIASEWLGVIWTDVSDFSERLDTISLTPTGGWGQHSYLYGGDTLFAAMEGYGVGVFDVRDAANPELIANIPGSFAHDLAFLDSIMCVARGSNYIFFNLAPFWRGGEIEPLDTFSIPVEWWENHACLSAAVLKTPTDTFFVLSIKDDGLSIIDPGDIPGVYARYHFFEDSRPIEVQCFGDTIFALMEDSFHIARFAGDSLERILDDISSILATGFYREGDFIAVTYSFFYGFKWFEWMTDSLVERGNWPWKSCIDIERFDGLIYAVYPNEGLFILDIDSPPGIDTLAWFPGSQGWENIVYGSRHVSFGPDSTIYLSDYHAGCYILEPFHRIPVNVKETKSERPCKFEIYSWPNPFNGAVKINIDAPFAETQNLASLQIEIFDLNGRRVAQLPSPSVPLPGGEGGKEVPLFKGDLGGSFTWQPTLTLASGVYLVRARFDSAQRSGSGAVATKRVVYLK